MFRKTRDAINNLIVLITRKAESSRKSFYELEKIAYKESAKFIYDNLSSAVLFNDIEKFWLYTCDQIPQTGAVMEFGVFSGRSINFFSGSFAKKGDKRTVYGFDSFEGLSENWGGTILPKGFFNVQGNLPKVNDNVSLVKGWIDKTYPEFIAKQNVANSKIAFIHVDVDTYTPTRIILQESINHLMEGSIILFDELAGYPGWQNHEYKALEETIGHVWNYEFVAFCETRKKDYTSDHIRATLRITSKK